MNNKIRIERKTRCLWKLGAWFVFCDEESGKLVVEQ
jgi:hypothetical protein